MVILTIAGPVDASISDIALDEWLLCDQTAKLIEDGEINDVDITLENLSFIHENPYRNRANLLIDEEKSFKAVRDYLQKAYEKNSEGTSNEKTHEKNDINKATKRRTNRNVSTNIITDKTNGNNRKSNKDKYDNGESNNDKYDNRVHPLIVITTPPRFRIPNFDDVIRRWARTDIGKHIVIPTTFGAEIDHIVNEVQNGLDGTLMSGRKKNVYPGLIFIPDDTIDYRGEIERAFIAQKPTSIPIVIGCKFNSLMKTRKPNFSSSHLSTRDQIILEMLYLYKPERVCLLDNFGIPNIEEIMQGINADLEENVGGGNEKSPGLNNTSKLIQIFRCPRYPLIPKMNLIIDNRVDFNNMHDKNVIYNSVISKTDDIPHEDTYKDIVDYLFFATDVDKALALPKKLEASENGIQDLMDLQQHRYDCYNSFYNRYQRNYDHNTIMTPVVRFSTHLCQFGGSGFELPYDQQVEEFFSRELGLEHIIEEIQNGMGYSKEFIRSSNSEMSPEDYPRQKLKKKDVQLANIPTPSNGSSPRSSPNGSPNSTSPYGGNANLSNGHAGAKPIMFFYGEPSSGNTQNSPTPANFPAQQMMPMMGSSQQLRMGGLSVSVLDPHTGRPVISQQWQNRSVAEYYDHRDRIQNERLDKDYYNRNRRENRNRTDGTLYYGNDQRTDDERPELTPRSKAKLNLNRSGNHGHFNVSSQFELQNLTPRSKSRLNVVASSSSSSNNPEMPNFNRCKSGFNSNMLNHVGTVQDFHQKIWRVESHQLWPKPLYPKQKADIGEQQQVSDTRQHLSTGYAWDRDAADREAAADIEIQENFQSRWNDNSTNPYRGMLTAANKLATALTQAPSMTAFHRPHLLDNAHLLDRSDHFCTGQESGSGLNSESNKNRYSHPKLGLDDWNPLKRHQETHMLGINSLPKEQQFEKPPDGDREDGVWDPSLYTITGLKKENMLEIHKSKGLLKPIGTHPLLLTKAPHDKAPREMYPAYDSQYSKFGPLLKTPELVVGSTSQEAKLRSPKIGLGLGVHHTNLGVHHTIGGATRGLKVPESIAVRGVGWEALKSNLSKNSQNSQDRGSKGSQGLPKQSTESLSRRQILELNQQGDSARNSAAHQEALESYSPDDQSGFTKSAQKGFTKWTHFTPLEPDCSTDGSFLVQSYDKIQGQSSTRILPDTSATILQQNAYAVSSASFAVPSSELSEGKLSEGDAGGNDKDLQKDGGKNSRGQGIIPEAVPRADAGSVENVEATNGDAGVVENVSSSAKDSPSKTSNYNTLPACLRTNTLRPHSKIRDILNGFFHFQWSQPTIVEPSPETFICDQCGKEHCANSFSLYLKGNFANPHGVPAMNYTGEINASGTTPDGVGNGLIDAPLKDERKHYCSGKCLQARIKESREANQILGMLAAEIRNKGYTSIRDAPSTNPTSRGGTSKDDNQKYDSNQRTIPVSDVQRQELHSRTKQMSNASLSNMRQNSVSGVRIDERYNTKEEIEGRNKNAKMAQGSAAFRQLSRNGSAKSYNNSAANLSPQGSAKSYGSGKSYSSGKSYGSGKSFNNSRKPSPGLQGGTARNNQSSNLSNHHWASTHRNHQWAQSLGGFKVTSKQSSTSAFQPFFVVPKSARKEKHRGVFFWNCKA